MTNGGWWKAEKRTRHARESAGGARGPVCTGDGARNTGMTVDLYRAANQGSVSAAPHACPVCVLPALNSVASLP